MANPPGPRRSQARPESASRCVDPRGSPADASIPRAGRRRRAPLTGVRPPGQAHPRPARTRWPSCCSRRPAVHVNQAEPRCKSHSQKPSPHAASACKSGCHLRARTGGGLSRRGTLHRQPMADAPVVQAGWCGAQFVQVLGDVSASDDQVALQRADNMRMLTHPPTRSARWRQTPAL